MKNIMWGFVSGNWAYLYSPAVDAWIAYLIAYEAL
jgi:hypothetical protein